MDVELMDKLSQIAPEIWREALASVHTSAMIMIVFAGIGALITLAMWVCAAVLFRQDDGGEDFAFGLLFGGFVPLIITVGLAINAGFRLAYPHAEAIKSLFR